MLHQAAAGHRRSTVGSFVLGTFSGPAAADAATTAFKIGLVLFTLIASLAVISSAGRPSAASI